MADHEILCFFFIGEPKPNIPSTSESQVPHVERGLSAVVRANEDENSLICGTLGGVICVLLVIIIIIVYLLWKKRKQGKVPYLLL